MMRGVNGMFASPLLPFLSLPLALEIASVSLVKNMSTTALTYPDQDLNAEQ